MAKILIVEDDENIAGTIKATLTMVGYTTEICYNGAEAVDMILEGQWDLVLLDVMLPGLDGFGVMEKIRGRETPVIGLRLGAEDYIVKPFEALELLARIVVVLRRKNKLAAVIKYGDITVDTEGHTVKKGDTPVALTPKEFQSLMLFLSNIDVAVTRERLLSTVWGYDFEGESRTVDIHVQQLRKKLGLHNHLVTIPKLGYRLNRYEEL